MKTIPQIRTRLYELAITLSCHELATLADETKRRPAVRRVGIRKGGLTPELRQPIKEYADAFPDASYLEISHALDVNTGRISEALAGFRDEGVI